VIHSGIEAWGEAMMGERQIDQAALFYEFSPERHVPTDHMLRAIDRFVDLEGGCTWPRSTARRVAPRLILNC
jgi:hypothetical protein